MRGLIYLAASLVALLPFQGTQGRDVVVLLVQQELGAERLAVNRTISELQLRLTSFSSRMQGFVPLGRPPFPVITIAPAQTSSLEVAAAGTWPSGTLAMIWGPIDSGRQSYRSNVFIDIGRASAFSGRPNRFHPVQTIVPRVGTNTVPEVGVAEALIEYAILARMLETELDMVEPVARELNQTILNAKRESTGFLLCLRQIELGRDQILGKLPEARRAARRGQRITYTPSPMRLGDCQRASR